MLQREGTADQQELEAQPEGIQPAILLMCASRWPQYDQRTMAPDAAPHFAFDQQQRSTLNVSGLAAYVQHPPKGRLGWVHVRQVWLPDWRPNKWAYEVQHLEVTFRSHDLHEQYEAEGREYDPWEVLMLTTYATFLTDELSAVEAYFSQFTEKPEFVRHPDRVGCPHEFVNTAWADETPARWSLVRRAWVAYLLCLEAEQHVVSWNTPQERLEGQVTQVSFNTLSLMTSDGVRQLWFTDRFHAQIYHREDDGSLRLWSEPSPREILFGEQLPVWDDQLRRWVKFGDPDGHHIPSDL